MDDDKIIKKVFKNNGIDYLLDEEYKGVEFAPMPKVVKELVEEARADTTKTLLERSVLSEEPSKDFEEWFETKYNNETGTYIIGDAEVINKTEEGISDYKEAYQQGFNMGMIASEDKLTEKYLKPIIEWQNTKDRKPAVNAFTLGFHRAIAYQIEGESFKERSRIKKLIEGITERYFKNEPPCIVCNNKEHQSQNLPIQSMIKIILSHLEDLSSKETSTKEQEASPREELKIGNKLDMLKKREACKCSYDCHCNCCYCKCIVKRSGKAITISLEQCCTEKPFLKVASKEEKRTGRKDHLEKVFGNGLSQNTEPTQPPSDKKE